MTYVSPVAASSTRLKIETYTPNIGAVIHDLDLTDLGDETIRGELHRALVDYQVLFFRNQTLTPEQQVAVARVFGDPDKAKAFFPRHAHQSTVEILEARPGVSRYGTDEWHADITFVANPPTGTVLYAQEIPASGGDTLWASATAVYDALPPSLQRSLEGLEAIHSFEHSGWPPYFVTQPDGEALYRKARADYLPVVHPVIRTHPVSGRKLVYVSPNFTDRIKGLARQQSDALLRLLFSGFERPDVQARLRWEKHTVAIWDNRSTLHYGVADYQQQHRLLHRVTFGEDNAF
jgi:taurine dioxygenase